MNRIYFDNAATTMTHSTVLEKSLELYKNDGYFNPSALYNPARNVKKHIEEVRGKVLSLFNTNYDLIFTSGGTEADNLAISSFAKRGNVVSTSGEHSAVFNTLTSLKQSGVEPRFAKLNRDGSVNVDCLLELVDDKTTFVSVTHVNNETGAINDVNLIARLVKQKNSKVIFHTDGVQSFLKIPYRISNDVDMFSFSAHKICALKGVGGLIYKKSISLKPLFFGGGQEKNIRSGTENTLGIYALGAAIDVFNNVKDNFEHVKVLNMRFKQELNDEVTLISSENASPYIISFSIPGVKAEIMQRVLDDNGLLVGTGSACSSKLGVSRIISNCGLDKRVADGVLRASFIYSSTIDEVVEATQIIKKCAQKLKVVLK